MLVIGCAAFLPHKFVIPVLLLAFVIRYLAGAYLSSSWNSWMRELIPDKEMGSIFGKRQQMMIGVSIILTLAAAPFIDNWSKLTNLPTVYGYTVIYCLSFVVGMYAVFCARSIAEPPPIETEDQLDVIAQLKEPFSDKVVLSTCAPLFVFSIFIWTFTTMPDRQVLTIPLLVFIHIATGIASAGITLASGNLTLKLAPRGKATGYLSASAIVNAASAGSAALIGGFTANFFAAIELGVIVRWADATNTTDLNAMNLTHWDFYFLFATVLGVYALHRLSLVEEHG
jgi:hypothetical protein